MEMKRERISITFDPRDMLSSLQIGFSFVRVAVACAIIEKISGLESLHLNHFFEVLEAYYGTKLLPFTLISL